MFPVPDHERGRLAALHALEILDTPPEELYDDVVKLAAAICDTPMAVINLIDADRQWGKALVGIESSEAPREVSFCARAIVQDDGMLVVPDTRNDPEWAENAMVTGDGGLRFYAGAAIVNDEGHALGTVCVADDRGPRQLGEQALEALRILARATAAHLKLRELAADLERTNLRLREMTITDGLTGIGNRALFERTLALELRQRMRARSHLGLLFCDLDGFKQVNDELGHHVGDRLLILVAERLAGAARGGDLVARFGGDEFAVLCPQLSRPEDLLEIAQRLHDELAAPAIIDGIEITPACSFGGAVARDADNIDSLLRRADTEMYESKRARRAAALSSPRAS